MIKELVSNLVSGIVYGRLSWTNDKDKPDDSAISPVPILYRLDPGPPYDTDFSVANPTQLVNIRDDKDRDVLKATYVPSSEGSPRLTFLRSFTPVDEATLEYKLWFEPGFDFVKGGKLPGLGPSSPLTGCADGTQYRWSVRIMWGLNGRPEIYYYGQVRGGSCGDSIAAPISVRFEPGREYKIKLYVKLNSPGQSNGIATLFINGQQVCSRDTLEFRGNTSHNSSRIQRLVFNTFFGGSDSSWSPPKIQEARFWDMRIK